MKYLAQFNLLCLLIVGLLISTSCRDVQEAKFLPLKYTLTSERIPLDFFESFQPYVMELKNGFLIFNYFDVVQIYSASDYSFACNLSSRRTQPIFQTAQILRSSLPYLYIIDVNNKNEITKYSIDSLGQPTLLQTSYTGINIAMNRPYIVNDSLIIYDEFVPEAALKILDLHTNKEVQALPYGTTSIDERFYDKNMGGMYVNDSCIAFAYKYQDRIDFYDWTFNLKHSVNHQKSEAVINIPVDVYDRPENTIYYGSSYMGRNYFYTLYRGVTNKVFRSDSLLVLGSPGVYIHGIIRDVLEVYDLEGQPICRFSFNDVAPEVFVVDEEHNILYGYRQVYSETLLVYSLQGLPKNNMKRPEYQRPLYSSLPFIKPDTSKIISYFEAAGTSEGVAPVYWIKRFLDAGGYRSVTNAGNFGLTELSK